MPFTSVLVSSLQWPLPGPVPVGRGSAVGRGAGRLSCALSGPECRGFGRVLPGTHHLLETALNYSELDLSKRGALTWRWEKRRVDVFFPPEILNARKIELFELMGCSKQ